MSNPKKDLLLALDVLDLIQPHNLCLLEHLQGVDPSAVIVLDLGLAHPPKSPGSESCINFKISDA